MTVSHLKANSSLDADDFEPPQAIAAEAAVNERDDRWEGEDEEDEVSLQRPRDLFTYTAEP